MKMDNTPPFLLHFKLLSEGGALGRHRTLHAKWHRPPQWESRVNLSASETSVALFQLSRNALELRGATTELLQ